GESGGKDMEVLGKVRTDMGNNVMHCIDASKKICITQISIKVDMVEIKSLVLELQGPVVKMEQGHKVCKYNLRLSSSDEEEQLEDHIPIT
ncbi:hypothetical protein KI387_036646, partial [Taxus chinensis]